MKLTTFTLAPDAPGGAAPTTTSSGSPTSGVAPATSSGGAVQPASGANPSNGPVGASAGAPAGGPPAGAPSTGTQSNASAAGASAPSTQGQAAQSAQPTTPALNERVAVGAIQSLLAPLEDPKAPETYSQSAWQKYQQDLMAVNSWRQFQQSMREVVSKPTNYADGVSFAFSSPEEVQEFGAYARDVANNKIQITGKDLLLLFRAKQLFQQASDHGARQYEAGLRGRGPQQVQTQQTQPVVPRPEDKESRGTPSVPSVATILKEKNPEFYAKLMAGQVQLT